MSDHQPTPIEVPIDRIRRPVMRVIHLENLSGIALIGGAVVALVLANTGLASTVDGFWHHHVEIVLGPIHLEESLVHWVNDGLMAIFFFVAGLEIKRELAVGDLRDPRKAALPAIAALGGMVVPALIFVAVSGPETRHGWGVPMATDIAFAVGVLTLLGNRVPSRLKVFLLTLAIVDDLGAIVVIAIFYTTSLDLGALAVALAVLGAMVVLRWLGVWWMPIYVLAGAGLWLAILESGIHATLAGVACGLLAPAKPRRPRDTRVVAGPEHTVDELKAIIFDTRETKSVVDRLIHGIHPFSALLIVPVFALANTGVGVSPSALRDGLTSSTGLAVLLGLVVGKPVGITIASWLAVKGNVARLPANTSWAQMIGVGFLAGIGFTVSLFITDLAFESQAAVDSSKIAVLTASVVASALGILFLLRVMDTDEASLSPDPADEELGPIRYDELEATAPDSFLAGGGGFEARDQPDRGTRS